MLLLGCSCTNDAPKDAGTVPAKAAAPASSAAPPLIDPARLAAKASPDPCGLVDPAALQPVLGLTEPPTATRGEATGPTRASCRYAWTQSGMPHHVEVAWATALQDDREEIAKGITLARTDLELGRVQELEIPGAVLATWGEQWLTVYANDVQVFWVVMEDSGTVPRDARNLAAAIAALAVQ